jgi:putative flippase GtrA
MTDGRVLKKLYSFFTLIVDSLASDRFTRCAEVLRFLFVGVFNTLCALAVYWLVLWLGTSIWLASFASLVFGVLVSFRNHSRYVFRGNGSFARYLLVWALIYLLNVFGLYLLRSDFGDYFVPIVLLPLNVAVSYVLFKLLVFR